ncbi:MAG: DUF58 domain-containing protein, partial [Lachnospiraceae bacterium]|nr:DUF58 domain-containing protein [Lachnospiraceae bacterium]
EYELFPHNGIKKETGLICKYRGEYDVGVRNVSVRDYLKLFNFTFRNRETLTVKVVPRLVILNEITSLDALTASAKETLTNATEPDVLVRDYIPGDDIRNINWKLTASTGKPMVRKRIGENAPGISIIMDSKRVSYEPEDYLPLENKLLEITLALAYYYLERGIRVCVYAYNSRPVFYALERVDDFEEFYETMASFSFDEDNTSEKLYGFTMEAPDIAASSAAIFVSHSMDEGYMMQAAVLEGNNIPTVTYLVTEEQVSAPGVITVGYDDKLEEVLV